MSGFSSQGVGLAASANAAVVNAEPVSAVSAVAVKMVMVENLVILHAPQRSEKKLVCNGGPPISEQITNADAASIRRACSPRDAPFKTLGFPAAPFATMFRFSARRKRCKIRHRDDSDASRHEDLSCCRVGCGDAGSGRPGGRVVQAVQQSENFLQPRPRRRQAQYRDLQILHL